jgi:hypothetical protein
VYTLYRAQYRREEGGMLVLQASNIRAQEGFSGFSGFS